MRKQDAWICSVLVGALVTSIAANVNADTITFDGPWPGAAEVIAATPDVASFGDDANVSLAQTFSVDSAFDATAIWLVYENDDRAVVDWNMTLTIFEVADVQASSIVAGATVYSGSFVFPYVGNADTVAAIELDTPLSLNASVGTAGYALQITEASGGDFNPGWEWLRTGSGDASVYDGGHGYEDGNEKGTGTAARDFTLAVSSVIPEPSSLALLLIGAVALVARRSRS